MNHIDILHKIPRKLGEFTKNNNFFNKNKDIIYCSVILFLTATSVGIRLMPQKDAENITYHVIKTVSQTSSQNGNQTVSEDNTTADVPGVYNVDQDLLIGYDYEIKNQNSSYSETGEGGMIILMNEDTYSSVGNNVSMLYAENEYSGGYTDSEQTSSSNTSYVQPSAPSYDESSAASSAEKPSSTPKSGSSTSSSSAKTSTSNKIKEGEAKVNINTANVSQLSRLPGVGEATAKKIIAYREEKGRFTNIKDIMKVQGIGDKKFQNMQQFITVD